jgi:hypothetical protein
MLKKFFKGEQNDMVTLLTLSTRANKGAAQTELTLVAVRRIRRPQATIGIILLHFSQYLEPHLKNLKVII